MSEKELDYYGRVESSLATTGAYSLYIFYLGCWHS